jgi:ribosomal protein L14
VQRRNFLRSLLALPLAPLAGKLLAKVPSFRVLPGIHDSVIVEVSGAFDHEMMTRVLKEVMLPHMQNYMRQSNAMLAYYDNKARQVGAKNETIVGSINGPTIETRGKQDLQKVA